MPLSFLQIMPKQTKIQKLDNLEIQSLNYEIEAKEILEEALIRYPFRQRAKIIKSLQVKYPDLNERTAYRWIDDIKQSWQKKVTDYDITNQVAQFQKIIERAEEELWKIILDKPVNPSELSENKVIKTRYGVGERVVVMALKQIVENRKRLFDVMMDSGFITRHLGAGEIKHAFLGGLFVQTDDGVKIKEQVKDMKSYIETRLSEVGLDLSQSSLTFAKDVDDFEEAEVDSNLDD